MLKELVQGMAFTLRQMFRKPITFSYPEEQKQIPARHRGRHILHRYDDGLEKCIGCELCSAACPVGCIYVEPAENDPEQPVSPGERFAARYEINLLRCIFCGYCAEACPTEAITLGPRFELTDGRRERTIATKEDLLEAWPAFDGARQGINPRGAGADQRERPVAHRSVDPRVAWEDREGAGAVSPGETLTGAQEGVKVHVPDVARPLPREGEQG